MAVRALWLCGQTEVMGTALGVWWVPMAGAALGFGAGSVKILRALGSFLHWEGAQGL